MTARDKSLPYDGDFFENTSSGSFASARTVLREVFGLVQIRSVVDVGCGVGAWLCAAYDLGAMRCLGIDGEYVDRTHLLVDPSDFRSHDLENAPLTGVVENGEKFDVAFCMEVAEHLSPQRAASFVAELCCLSDLVLFSAAIPQQGGINHINEQWPGYWASLFSGQGFDCFDVLRPRLWNEVDCEFWYAQNVMLFARRHSGAIEQVSRLGPPSQEPLALVHPRKYTEVTEELLWRRAENAAILASRSWRATAPLRWVFSRFRRCQ